MICTVEGCTTRAHCRGMCKKHARRSAGYAPRRDWSAEEVRILLANYAAWGPSQLTELLHGRTAKAIKVKAGALGIAKPHAPRLELDPHGDTMVGAALCMWKGPVNRSRALSPAIGRVA